MKALLLVSKVLTLLKMIFPFRINMLNNATILVTGGTGTIGRHVVDALLEENIYKVIVFSRDELKQHEMREELNDDRVRYFLGDIRDKDRLYRSLQGVDYVIHTAALKQVGAAEYNPLECIKTNILGSSNIIDASIDCDVKKVLAISTDKAVNPINLYGASKLCSDKLFLSGNAYSGQHKTIFAVARFGNIIGSRGSVIPLFQKMKPTGTLKVTDLNMTRYFITPEESAQHILNFLDEMKGEEIFIPKMKACKVSTVVEAIAPECKVDLIGMQPGEKMHEVLINQHEREYTEDRGNYFAITSSKNTSWNIEHSSSMNANRLYLEELKELL